MKPDKIGARYARYFSCGRQYIAEEKLVISLLKRSQVGRLLKTMVETPGLPKTESSRTMGLLGSDVSWYLIWLAEHGIVVKRRADNGKLFYIIDEQYLPVIVGQIGA